MKSLRIITIIVLNSCVNIALYGQSENIGISGSTLSPAPTTVGGSLQACFNFSAINGVTLNPGEDIKINVCFNKITPQSIGGNVPTVQYGALGSQNFIHFDYIPVLGGNCYEGEITQNLLTFSGAKVCFNNLSASESVTLAEANAAAGVGFSVNLVPHSRDPATNDTDDFEEIYTFTSEELTDLAVYKSVNVERPRVGEIVKFTIIAENLGNNIVSDINVSDQLPTGLTFVSDSLSAGVWEDPNWKLDSLGSLQRDTLILSATVNPNGNYVNSVEISSLQVDSDSSNNTATASVNPYRPSIALVKTGALNSTLDSILYTFTIYNTGDSLLSNIDILDIKLGGSLIDFPLSLNAGESHEMEYVYAVTPSDRLLGSVTNSATVQATPPSGADVTDISGSTILDDTETIVPVPRCPAGVKCLSVRSTRIK
jgi:uncharacterized repeat protein (TIGR01451 family)